MAHDEDFSKNRFLKFIEKILSHIFQYDGSFVRLLLTPSTEFFIFDL